MFCALKFVVVTILAFLVLTPEATAQCAASKGLTGAWHANDGGTYYVRRVDATVWWMGQSSDGGRSWTHVFRGTINGDIITGEWADVIHNSGSGTLTLRIKGVLGKYVHGFDRIANSGSGFSGIHWFKPCNDTP